MTETNYSPIRAEFVDFKTVKTRKVAQFVFEMPLEEFDSNLGNLGGCPMPDKSRMCAIVLMDPMATEF